MDLDVIVPTHDRRPLLEAALRSLLEADVPPGLRVRITVVDNHSTDDTRAAVERWMREHDGIAYLFEPRQGKSHALNAGIAATKGELVGMIDDDEEIDRGWYGAVHAALAAPEVDFVGGPCRPRWGAPPPAWLPAEYRGMIGWVDGGDRPVALDAGYPGILTGGNAVVRRTVLERVGPYATALGPRGRRRLASEDEEMYGRLLAAGARGRYLPDLVIHHHVPPARLTRGYFRRCCFWRGVTRGRLDRDRPQPVPYLAGVPRYLVGRAARGVLRWGGAMAGRRRDAAADFAAELAMWDLAGFFYGKHVHGD